MTTEQAGLFQGYRPWPRLLATYHIRCEARSADERAQAIAVEQSVEMPLAGQIDDRYVLDEIVYVVHSVREISSGLFEGADIPLSARDRRTPTPGSSSTCCSATPSIDDDVVLHDAEIPR